MKVKVLSRNPDDYVRDSKLDLHKMPRNLDPSLHPFEVSREYTRALNATKLQRLFAKPFLASLDGHRDGVHCLAKHPTSLSLLLSGSYDGEIRLWNVPGRDCLHSWRAHEGFVRGLSCCPSGRNAGNYVLSCGDDKTVRMWPLREEYELEVSAPHSIYDKSNWAERRFVAGQAASSISSSTPSQRNTVDDSDDNDNDNENDDNKDETETSSGLGHKPLRSYMSSGVLYGVDHAHNSDKFATCGEVVNIWNVDRSEPLNTLEWNIDTIAVVRFNAAEVNLLAGLGSDRSIILYDLRERTPLRKLTLQMRSNDLKFNPMEPMMFTVANEDYNLYCFDVRSLNRPVNIYRDHTSAVMAVDYAPTGEQLVSGSFDKTVRVFEAGKGHSRDVYHTKRMQRVICVAWSLDNRYIFSGSDEMNIRMWKANASEKLGALRPRERAAFCYADSLREKFATHTEVHRIARHRHVPKHVRHGQRELQTIRASRRRKEANRRQHSRQGSMPWLSERSKVVLKVER